MKLCDMVTLKIDNAECVVLKVKDGQEMNLLGLGCFNGNEKILRLTKGKTVTCTVICDDGHRYSWHWGADGYTLVTDAATFIATGTLKLKAAFIDKNIF